MSGEPAGAPIEPPAKVAPDALALRGTPRRVVRIRRAMIVGGAATGAALILSAAWLAFAHQTVAIGHPAARHDLPDRRPLAEAIAHLPGAYDQVPKLGPPLPGDLGGPILEHQQQVGLDEPAATTPEQHARDVEHQRVAAQDLQARESGVIIAAPTLPASGGAKEPASPGPGAVADAAGKTQEDGLALDPEHDPNEQARKLDFLQSARLDSIYEGHALQKPASPYELMAGTMIAASLITGLDSDLPGMVIAQVTNNVFDTATGRILLLPQGSRLIGRYDSVVAFGQKRAQLIWQRIILPDGSSIQIDNWPAADAAGHVGLQDRVDGHGWRLLKGVALSTLLGVGAQVSLGSNQHDLIQAIRESGQQSATQAGQRIVAKELDVQPTLKVRPGWPLRVIVEKDLILQPWDTTAAGDATWRN